MIAGDLTRLEVQQEAQQEIDNVICLDRMPVIDDIERLPYVQAIINGAHRLRPVTPLSVPHSATEDIQYGNYVNPKGAIIFENTWAVFHNEERFENPDSAKIIEYFFGSGRRICAGRHLGNNSMILNTMNILWGFNIEMACDKKGKKMFPDMDNYGFINIPRAFQCSILPRSGQHEAVLCQEFRNTEGSFASFEQDLSAEDDKSYAQEVRQKA